MKNRYDELLDEIQETVDSNRAEYLASNLYTPKIYKAIALKRGTQQ